MIKTSPIWLSLILSSTLLAQAPAPDAAAAPGTTVPQPTSKAADDHEVLRPALLTPRDAGNTFIYLQAYHVKSEKFNSCLMAVRGMPEIEALRQNGITLNEMSYKHYVNPKLVRKEVNDSCHNFDKIIIACARLGVWVPDASGFMEGHLCQNYRELKYDRIKQGKDDVSSKKHKRKSKKKPAASTLDAGAAPTDAGATPSTPDAVTAPTPETATPPGTSTTPDAATTPTPSVAPTAGTETPGPEAAQAAAPTAGLTPPAAPVSTPVATPEAPATPAVEAVATPTTAAPVPAPTTPEVAATATPAPTSPEAVAPVPAPTTTPAPITPTPSTSTTQQPASVTG